MTALEFERVRHVFGDLVAVEDFSLAVEEGEIVCLLGPSGCGKTTALRLAAGLEPLQDGVVRLNGDIVAGDGREQPPEARSVGLVFQDYALFPHLNVLDNVSFGLRGLPAAKRQARGLEVLELVGMEASASVYPHTLSGGQQQRVALARALAPEPRILLLDEPFSGLDTRLRDRVRDDTLHVLKLSGTSCLVVTHDPEEAMFMGDRVVLMRNGNIVQSGRPDSLYCQPANAFVAGFFGDINRLEGRVTGHLVATPFGPLSGGELPDGTPVEVLIRPEALRLRPVEEAEVMQYGGGLGLARVIASRMLGRTSLIHLSLADGRDGAGAEDVHLHARVPGTFLPDQDAAMEIDLDRSQAFVFPLEGGA